jgi:serine/threonine protein kinase
MDESKYTNKGTVKLIRRNKTRKPYNNSVKTVTKQRCRQNGGLKLGQGSFGCVLTPPIKCPNSQATQQLQPGQTEVSKIVYTNPAAKFKYDREMRILRMVSEVDKKQNYLIGLVDECELDISAIAKRRIKDTAIVKFTNDERSEWKISTPDTQLPPLAAGNKKDKLGNTVENSLVNLSKSEIKSNYCLVDPTLKPRNQIQVNGGMQFDDVLENHRSRNYAVVRRYYINIIRDVLVGIQLMHKVKIAHRDIKESNMVCQVIPIKRKGKPDDFYPVVRHIDFGLAEIGDIAKNYLLKGVRYAGTSKYIPPDIGLMGSRVKNMQSVVGPDTSKDALQKLTNPETKQKIISELTERLNNKDYCDFSVLGIRPSFGTGIQSNSQTDDFVDSNSLSELYDLLVRELLDGSFSQKYSKDYDGYLYKTDIFAAGITIAGIKYELGIRNPKLNDLIANMVRIDPNKRFNINQCLAHPVFKN